MIDKKYIEGVGRRKTAVARVRITPSTKGEVTVNDQSLKTYFVTPVLQDMAVASATLTEMNGALTITVKVNGGGITSQAAAVRMGLARALAKWKPELRTPLKTAKYLSRDARMKERRKFGLKKARKSPQWSKR
ncbi:MAG: 30S ribosomal protein S9 [Candidatus Vogelbacteria bacterium]|nr:30S ribosomal protein S9 [Candidatus Vogelbacteria bacterium]